MVLGAGFRESAQAESGLIWISLISSSIHCLMACQPPRATRATHQQIATDKACVDDWLKLGLEGSDPVDARFAD
jgi:hypothetical protein